MFGLALLALLSAGHTAFADKRVALVIGNAAYQKAPELINPKNDAEDMAAALKALGFTLILGLDLDKRAMDRKIIEFESALSGADAAVFHYSGHGLQVAGVNYLVPVDAELASVAALRIEAVRLDFVQETMEREAKTNILFLDACRNNPLARNLARALGTRSVDIGRGFAATEAGVDTLISFSTQPGNVALDGSGRNSPYSGSLVKTIGTPGKDLSSILIAVRNEVLAATGEKQVPWQHSALRAPFYFKPPAPALASPPQGAQPPLSEAAQAWSEIKDLKDIPVFETFRKQYGPANALYDTLAAQRIADLRRVQMAAAPREEEPIQPSRLGQPLTPSKPLAGQKPKNGTNRHELARHALILARAQSSGGQCWADGAPGKARTCNLQIRSLMLYPLSYEREIIERDCSIETRVRRRLHYLSPLWAKDLPR